MQIPTTPRNRLHRKSKTDLSFLRFALNDNMQRPQKKKKEGKKMSCICCLPPNVLSDLKWAARTNCNICASLNHDASGERVTQAHGWRMRRDGGGIQREKHQVGGTATPVTRGASDVPSGRHIKAEGKSCMCENIKMRVQKTSSTPTQPLHPSHALQICSIAL